MMDELVRALQDDVDYLTTDAGNAERLVLEHGKNFQYCDALGGWLHWNGRRWEVDNSAIWDASEQVGKAFQREAAEAEDRNVADRLWQHGRYTLSERGMSRMIALANKDSRMRVGAELFDSDPYLLNVQNGTIDIRSGELRPHQRNDLITKITSISYDESATADRWQSFIRRVLPDEDVRRYVQKAIGQAMTGVADEQAFYLNHGVGDNGKNTLYDTILTMLGDYADTMNIDTLMEKRNGGGASPELAKLKGKRFVVASESDENQRLKPGLIKRLTGDKYIEARALYKDPMKFERTHTIFMHANHRPEIADTGHAMWRRVRLIPWTVRIPNGEKDKRLPYKLGQELSGILNWCLQGYRLYAEEGLEPPEAVREATDEYRKDMDKVGQFIADECVTDHPNLYVTKDALYEAYSTWCFKNNVGTEKKRKFGEKMIEHRYDDEVRKISGKATRVWLAIGLQENYPSNW
jgi:putative DNA primase/helicase